MSPRMPTAQVGDSPRVRLAHLALGAALNDMAAQLEARLGVSVIAQPGGRYSVDLCLVAGMVPLIELAAEVRRRVQARVAREGLGDQLGDVNVQFSEVLSAAEIAEQAAARERAALAAAQEIAAAGAEHADPVLRPRPEELPP